jgi:hypothetical protein
MTCFAWSPLTGAKEGAGAGLAAAVAGGDAVFDMFAWTLLAWLVWGPPHATSTSEAVTANKAARINSPVIDEIVVIRKPSSCRRSFR